LFLRVEVAEIVPSATKMSNHARLLGPVPYSAAFFGQKGVDVFYVDAPVLAAHADGERDLQAPSLIR
jgi:hypothetical protein